MATTVDSPSAWRATPRTESQPNTWNGTPPATWHGTPPATVQVEPTRRRATEEQPSGFGSVLAATTKVLLSGARVATTMVAGPTLAAAIPAAAVPAAANAVDAAATGGAGGAGAPGGELAQMAAMQRESQVFNMQLLELQEQVQQENRRFTTLSNVLRAKHDTAKAAVSNIRS